MSSATENFEEEMNQVSSGEEGDRNETGALLRASNAISAAQAVQATIQYNATLEDLSEGLKKSQVCIGELTEALRSVKLELLQERSSKSKKRSKASSSSGKVSATFDVTRLGKKYGFMYYMWATKDIFTRIQRPTIPITIADAYSTDAGWRAFIAGELYSFVPRQLHSEMEGLQKFRDDFAEGITEIRQTLTGRVKSYIPQFFKIPGFNADSNPADFPEVLKLLYVRGKITQYPPILFEGGIVDMGKIFRNPLLHWIGRLCLFGEKSLSSSNTPKAARSKKTNAPLWEVTRTTTGMIATCAIFAIFLVSPDKQLSAKGDISKFEYAVMWKHYQEILDRNVNGIYNGLFELFDDFIFKDAPEEDKGQQHGEMQIQSVQETMRQMQLGILNPDFLPENSPGIGLEPSFVCPLTSVDGDADVTGTPVDSDSSVHEDAPIVSSSSTRAKGRGRGRGRSRGRGVTQNVAADPEPPQRATRKTGRNA